MEIGGRTEYADDCALSKISRNARVSGFGTQPRSFLDRARVEFFVKLLAAGHVFQLRRGPPEFRSRLMAASEADRQLVQRIRAGEPDAWQQCIDLYEGRLLAFARTRLQDRSAAEDIVQETLLGFLKALPNYDDRTPLESWLFSIAAHKLIDFMRRSGRRPMLPLLTSESKEGAARDLTGPGRAASSMMRSSEKTRAESTLVESCLQELVNEFKAAGAWERLKCVELIFVLGWANKDVALRLNITEQAVANHKFFVVSKLKDAAKTARLSEAAVTALGLD